jgi:hypothetical protein
MKQKEQKELKLEKVVVYIYPDGTKTNDYREYFLLNIIVYMGLWIYSIIEAIFYPILFLFGKTERKHYLKKKVYWREIK